MAQIVFDRVSKTYDDGCEAVRGLDLVVEDGEFLVLVGPSGCGKSTALRLVAGLEDITGGELRIDGHVANALSPRARDIAMVFQSYALYPHLTVGQNIGFGLRVRGYGRAQVAAKVREAADLLELTAFLDRKPAKLSGGQRQRVAMGRALVRSPNAFLMDEPLSNLDARLRGQMRAEIAKLQDLAKVTTLYVTHDQVEAMTMGHRVAVMRDGRVQQHDVPRRLYDAPANTFVAGFIGAPQMNFLAGVLEGERTAPRLRIGSATLDLDAGIGGGHAGPVIVGIRPEALQPAEAGASTSTLAGAIAFIEDLGASLLVHCEMREPVLVGIGTHGKDDDLAAIPLRLRAVLAGGLRLARGEALAFAVDPAGLHLFDAVTGDAIAQRDAQGDTQGDARRDALFSPVTPAPPHW